MLKILLVFVLATLVADTFGGRIIIVRRLPPRRVVIIRKGRDLSNQPLWLNQGDIPKAPASSDHPVLPNIIDDVKLDSNRRYARGVNDQPLWLNQGDIPKAPASGDHPVLPNIIDDVKLDPNRRYARDVNDQPLWLNQGDIPKAPASGDHPVLPNIIDDVKLDPNRRYARSVDSPSARRSGGGSRSSGNHDTGRTHPGYNRRNARYVDYNDWRRPRPTVGPVRPHATLPPFWPKF
ncbi:lebocin-4-like [Bicyclus anynana]|uniref:Lebocin-4-like n=1 Tax=Bicyclus anynana TaxID=110368 RepID=A0A6J1N0W8_BICAN|nr:lebocin-4-like [Bicyclus anynana]